MNAAAQVARAAADGHTLLLATSTTLVTGLEAVRVPYKGNAPELNDVVAGHVQIMIGDFATSNELFRGGRVGALGVSTATRVSAAPDIPTLAEAGVPGYDASAWQMVVAPAVPSAASGSARSSTCAAKRAPP